MMVKKLERVWGMDGWMRDWDRVNRGEGGVKGQKSVTLTVGGGRGENVQGRLERKGREGWRERVSDDWGTERRNDRDMKGV